MLPPNLVSFRVVFNEVCISTNYLTLYSDILWMVSMLLLTSCQVADLK
jgi:hypothetical protein